MKSRSAKWITDLSRSGGFTLVELLVVVSVIALLISILLPSLQKARKQAQTTVCASNIRQLAVANLAYAADNSGRLCCGAPDVRGDNLYRWYGCREDKNGVFDSLRGPLSPFLAFNEGIRACPAFQHFVIEERKAFERGCGGYGYNNAYLGRILAKVPGGSFKRVTDEVGVLSERIKRPCETVMFADTAIAGVDQGVIEYSFAEPRFHPEYIQLQGRVDPSIHFRHNRSANIAWADGHVDGRKRTFTWKSGVYQGDPDLNHLGWFGQNDDNSLFDLE